MNNSAIHAHVTAVAAVIVRDGKVCLIRSKKNGYVLTPGGRLEPGETLDEALVREVREETGLTVTRIGQLLGVDKQPTYTLYIVEADADGELVAGDDAAEAWWGTAEEVRDSAKPRDYPFILDVLRARKERQELEALRAEIAHLRFGQGLVPAWGFVANYLFGRAEGRILDDGGRASVQALGRFDPDFIDGFALHMPTLDKPVFTEELKMPATLLWIERSTAEDLISFLPEGKAPATRLHLAHMLDLARLIEAQTPSWLAAMAMNRRHARSVAPAWMLGQWGIDDDPDVRGRLDDTMARLARLESPA